MASTQADSSSIESSSEDRQPAEKVEKKGVFVNRDGVARFIEVTTGINDQQNYEVLAGLEEDDEVITGTFRTLRTIKDSTDIKVENRHVKEENN
jgi:HlyD family secretion protein